MERAFEYLHAPIVRVAGRNSPIPFADSIEEGVWPSVYDVEEAVKQVMKY
jgi:pyruvate dehydrogenase E1 component beta subunit